MVLFLEEDHYVAEDFIHMLNLLKATADKSCPNCEILSLGTYLKTYQYHVNGDKVSYHHLLSLIEQHYSSQTGVMSKYMLKWAYAHCYDKEYVCVCEILNV